MAGRWKPSEFSSEGGPVKVGDRIGISYNLGKINHPTYGKSNGELRGTIRLFLPHGSFIVPSILYDEESLDKLTKEMVEKVRFLWENELDEDIEAKIKDYVKISVLYNDPESDMFSEDMKARSLAATMAFIIDDYIDSSEDVGKDGLKYEDMQIGETVDKILSGATLDEIPCCAPLLVPLFKALIDVRNHLEAYVHNFKERNGPLRQALYSCFMGGLIILGNKGEPDQVLSEQTIKTLNGYVSGFMSSMEIAFLSASDTNIPAEVRNDVLFQAYTVNLGIAYTLINAVLGLVRDVENDQVMDTPILRFVVNKVIPLQPAY
jgi:hypothetical protein